ncbi:hypothetical protein DAPPUDRAFT_342160 [Daphnia pulex]|uniref:bAvd-like domain-containing protein n=1 Tax=Daphnia pulex TaxID=6669 RepID=E9I5S7_DAPPU|nr:hypothetical protein DAPPUDRAFT_342160 [Daphnia pulex]|eukprot:EFX60653.1 hypothetical protein DAPPUDRAFT_342160 [Daphnia pulex]
MQLPPVYSKAYHLSESLLKCTAHFPKQHRPTLGRRIEDSALDLATQLRRFLLGSAPRELPSLLATVDDLKVYLQLAHELTCLSHAQYHELSQSVSIIGKMLGGMKRYLDGGTNTEAIGQSPC